MTTTDITLNISDTPNSPDILNASDILNTSESPDEKNNNNTRIRRTSSATELRFRRRRASAIKRESGIKKTVYGLHTKIKRMMGYLFQLQESVRPDKTYILINIGLFILTAITNIIEYFGFALANLILNITLLLLSVVLFLYALYHQLTFSLKRVETDGMFMIEKREDSVYEIKIIRSETEPVLQKRLSVMEI